MAAEMDETKGGYISANCKSQDVLSFATPMPEQDEAEAPDGAGAKRAIEQASDFTTRSSPCGPRIGAAEEK
jgi:hypothetical protein